MKRKDVIDCGWGTKACRLTSESRSKYISRTEKTCTCKFETVAVKFGIFNFSYSAIYRYESDKCVTNIQHSAFTIPSNCLYTKNLNLASVDLSIHHLQAYINVKFIDILLTTIDIDS